VGYGNQTSKIVNKKPPVINPWFFVLLRKVGSLIIRQIAIKFVMNTAGALVAIVLTKFKSKRFLHNYNRKPEINKPETRNTRSHIPNVTLTYIPSQN
jgi:hypothetical protein